MDSWDTESVTKNTEKPGKTLEWSALPSVDTSNTEGADSDASSHQIVLHSGAKKVTDHPLQGADLAFSEKMQEYARSSSRHTEGEVECTSLSPFSNL